MEIQNSNINDIDTIYSLYGLASAYQKAKQTVVVWPEFERTLIETEIAENRQWKLFIDGTIACVWATTFSDAQIWEDKNEDPAVYIHRIATNPDFRGHHFVQIIVDWAKEYAKEHQKKFVRLDTLGNNTRLIALYTSVGFNFLGLFDLKSTSELPAHYQNAPACLFEIAL